MHVLLLLAHADDEALGTGGMVQRLVADGHDIQLIIVSDGVVGMRTDGPGDNREALRASCEILGIGDWQCLDFPDQRFDALPIAEIANRVAEETGEPDLIVSHADSDLNRDHRITAEVARIVGRPRRRATSILACEIPMVSPWNDHPFDPNFFVEMSEEELDNKIAAFAAYENETRQFPDPFSEEGLRNLARFRGQQSGYRAAEAFRVIRWYL